MGILVGILKIIFVVVAILMTFFILLQEGKGGGLAGLGGTRAAGVEGVTNPIRRATAVLAGLFFLLAILIGWLSRSPGGQSSEGIFDSEKGAKSEVGTKIEIPPGMTLEPKPVPVEKPESKAEQKPGGAAPNKAKTEGEPAQAAPKAEEKTTAKPEAAAQPQGKGEAAPAPKAEAKAEEKPAPAPAPKAP
jgi:protein translocase SecG subunit